MHNNNSNTIVQESELPKFANDLKEAIGAMRLSEGVVDLAAAAAPQPTLRNLCRNACGGRDTDAERQDLWQRTALHRKKHVNLVLVQNPKDNKSYFDAMRQSKGVQEFRGRAGVEHRVFVLSCDLMNQSGKTPWVTASLPDADILAACCEFLLAHARGPYDIIMAWDGCQRKSRRTLEDSVGQLHTCAEVFMVYTKSWNHWAAQKVFLGSENTECGYINTPLGRTKKFIKNRGGGGFNAAGEETSHYVSFTGVVPPSRMSLARITPANKLQVFPDATADLPSSWTNQAAGVPMFWAETKSVATWSTLLTELNAKFCVDLTPGSGLLAQACMEKNVAYTGLVHNNAHYQWLTNCVDRAALQVIGAPGSLLYNQDLSVEIAELFPDVIEAPPDAVADDIIAVSDMEE